MNAIVIGFPRWRAKYLEEAICRFKWLAAAALILWLVTGFAMTNIPIDDFNEAIFNIDILKNLNHLKYSSKILIWSTLAISIFGCVVILCFTPHRLSINGCKWLVLFVMLTSLTGEGLHLGLSHFNIVHIISFDLVLLLTFAMAPISTLWAAFLILTSLIIVVLSSVMTGHILEKGNILLLTNPLSYAIIGLVVQRWYYRRFRIEWLTSLRLKRRSKQLERQALLIESQKDEAEARKSEITLQRGNLLRALSSALTEPVARAYHEQGHFRSQLKSVCVIACDAVGFSNSCKKLQPDRVIFELEKFFCEFDSACFRYTVEPLRAQGDSRIAIAGLWPSDGQELHHEVISAILAMLTFKKLLPNAEDIESYVNNRVFWPARIGISLGSVACGIIDTSKGATFTQTSSHDYTNQGSTNPGRLWFDVWGDTVNVATRLEQAAKTNQILVMESVLWETRGLFEYGPIHELTVKSTHMPEVAEIIGIKEEYCNDSGEPNEEFWDIYNAHNIRPHKPKLEGTKAYLATI